MRPKQIWIILLLFTFTFGGGVAAGFLLRAAIEPTPPQPVHGMGMRPDGRTRERVAERLNLTAEQADRFHDIVDEHRRTNRRRMASVRDSMEAVMRVEMDSLNARLAEVLTPEQLEEWRRMSRQGARTNAFDGR